jgi:hypothetical protein
MAPDLTAISLRLRGRGTARERLALADRVRSDFQGLGKASVSAWLV